MKTRRQETADMVFYALPMTDVTKTISSRELYPACVNDYCQIYWNDHFKKKNHVFCSPFIQQKNKMLIQCLHRLVNYNIKSGEMKNELERNVVYHSIPFHACQFEGKFDVIVDPEMLGGSMSNTKWIIKFCLQKRPVKDSSNVLVHFEKWKYSLMQLAMQMHVLKHLYPCVHFQPVLMFQDLSILVLDWENEQEEYVRVWRQTFQTICRHIRWIQKWTTTLHCCFEEDKIPRLLYPNMKIKVDDPDLALWKRNIAEKYGEITLLWMCSLSIRQEFWKEYPHLCGWKDEGFDIDMLNVRGDSRKQILKNIWEINMNDSDWKIGSSLEIDPSQLEIFLDFETIPFRNQFIYLIGCYIVEYNDNSEIISTQYKAYWADSLTLEGEKRLLQRIEKQLDRWKNEWDCQIYYYYAEARFWKQAMDRLGIDSNHEVDDWIDLCEIFRSLPLVIKGCFDFSLKSIVKGLAKLGILEKDYSILECQNGLDSVKWAEKIYDRYEPQRHKQEWRDQLELYNEMDCQVLHHILKWIRNVQNCSVSVESGSASVEDPTRDAIVSKY